MQSLLTNSWRLLPQLAEPLQRRQPGARAATQRPAVAAPALHRFVMPTGKRLFDILVAGTLLVLLLPLFAVIALLIWLESPGPIFYYAYRVGTNYRAFRFWKFRSMRPGADKLLANMQGLNQYQTNTAAPEATACACGTPVCQAPLIDKQGGALCEQLHRQRQQAQGEAGTFIKIVNDPRVTRIGTFIRNTSIDELPQLFNVLRGDMSLVGNRPLPLYEAEKLTTDQFAARFLAPAGITGLWQVSKRGGTGPMSAEERKLLDVKYARSYSLKDDLKILLKTVPALFQQENV
ncbi:MAG: sugar transferase [Janthinobacterium lividum]